MKSIRLVSLGLAALLAAGALGGCKGSGDSDVKSPYDFEKYDPVVELTTDRYITSEDGLSAWEDDPYIRWAEVNLGIRWKPKFVVASKQEHDQKLVLLAATDDLPDVICDAPAYLVKQWQQGGFLRVLQDDIEQWGSDLTKYLILDEYQKQSNGAGFAGYTTADGKFYALPMVLDPQAGAWPKLFYRSDILDELGMKEPTTLVELEEVFAAFKEKYPDQAAYVLDDYFFGLASSVFQLHGCNLNTYYEKDGQIVFGSIQPEAKDALATLRDMGLSVEAPEYQFDDEVPANYIISYTPAEGTELKAGDSVHLVVSKGPEASKVTLISFADMAQSDAESRIRLMNLEVGEIEHVSSETVPEGKVVEQWPEAGTEVEEGSKVNLTVSTGPENPDIPQTSTKTLTINLPVVDETDPVQSINVMVTSDDGKEVYNRDVNPLMEVAVSVPVSGTGKVTYNVYFNGRLDHGVTVNFDE